jgi:DNA-binding response OmpR family regulator
MKKDMAEGREEMMVVEDDQIVAGILHHMLSRRGYKVHVAKNGLEALEMLETLEPPKLVMLDVMLPFLDGYELIDRIRGHATWAEVPIIMLTSKSRESSIVRALDAGATDYVIKPFQPEELMARVRRFVK